MSAFIHGGLCTGQDGWRTCVRCIAQVSPIVPPAGAALPITEPTLFRVPVVIDDRDVYPPQPDDSSLGVTKFQWSVLGPGGIVHSTVPGATGIRGIYNDIDNPSGYALPAVRLSDMMKSNAAGVWSGRL